MWQASHTILPSMTCSSSNTLSITDGLANVTNPNPRGVWVYLSFIITESVISPYFSKCLAKFSVNIQQRQKNEFHVI